MRGSAAEPDPGDTLAIVTDDVEKAMNVDTLDRLVLQVTLISGLIALVLLPW